jgi:hypothetical protein
MMERGLLVGSWRLRSGNAVDCYLLDRNHARCVWERLPPSKRDKREYIGRIMPEINEELRRMLKVDPAGRTLWVLT